MRWRNRRGVAKVSESMSSVETPYTTPSCGATTGRDTKIIGSLLPVHGGRGLEGGLRSHSTRQLGLRCVVCCVREHGGLMPHRGRIFTYIA